MTDNSDIGIGDGGAWDDDDDFLAMLDDDEATDGNTNAMISIRMEDEVAENQNGIPGDAKSNSYYAARHDHDDDVIAVPLNAAPSHIIADKMVGIVNTGWDEDDDLDLALNEDEHCSSSGGNHNDHHDSTDVDDNVVTEPQLPTTTATADSEVIFTNTTHTQIIDSSATNVEEWDFDEDKDIFNENNLQLGDLDDEKDPEKAGIIQGGLVNEIPRPPPPMPLSAAAIGIASHSSQSWQMGQSVKEAHPTNENRKSSTEYNANIITSNNHTNINGSDDNDTSGAAGWSDDEYCFDDDEDVKEEDNDLNLTTSSAPLPSLMIPPPPHPKPVPPSPFPSVQSPPVAHRTRAKSSQYQLSKQKSAFIDEEVVEEQDVPPPPILLFNPAQRRNHQMLITYMSSLHDSNFVTRLHQKLHLYQSKSTTIRKGSSMTLAAGGAVAASAASAAADLRTYYAARPGLRKYTLGVELDRMDYTLILSNGKLVCDKDVIRSYFGVHEDGETFGGGGSDEDDTIIATEELLIRSANQSLLADLLVALTGAEDDILIQNRSVGGGHDNGDSFFPEEEVPSQDTTVLILSGPTLCMTSVAESCQFKVDLQCGFVEAVCSLAISIPYHHEHNKHGSIPAVATDDHANEAQTANGRLVLARAKVSVRFRPGGEGGDCDDEPTVQYAVRSVSPLLTPDSGLLQKAAISLAKDQDDPFFHHEYADIDSNDGAADARDLFLLSHHLADSGLLVVSDHIDKLRDAAAAKSSGFRSALRQLDGVTNVSSKLQGLGRFGLALPSAEEIEAAEQEAVGAARHLPRPPPPPGAEFRSRLQGNVIGDNPSLMQNIRSTEARIPPPPPPRRPPPPLGPPPPLMPSRTEPSGRPRPILGGLLMSGLSRLAAAATQPDDHSHSGWEGTEGSGGTGLTPPSSPPNGNGHTRSTLKEVPRLYRTEGDERDGRGGNNTGTAPSVAKTQPRQNVTVIPTPVPTVPSSHQTDELVDDGNDDDAGWSDEEFDFEDGGDDVGHSGVGKQDMVAKMETATSVEVIAESNSKEVDDEPTQISIVCSEPPIAPGSKRLHSNHPALALPPHPSEQQTSNPTTYQHSRTFEEEFVMVLKEKIDAECQERKEHGRMKRWIPIREDPILRQQLMEVMVAQIQS